MTAPSSVCDASLVALQMALEQSLLQYVSEANLWVDGGHAGATATLQRLAKSQRESSAAVGELLASRRLLPELVSFPTEYAQWHYLALSYVLARLVENQQQVAAVAADAVAACSEGIAAAVLKSIAEREANHLEELRRLGEPLHPPRAG
jgi:hypothetical protein